MENYLINTMWCAIKCNEDLLGIGVFFEPGKYDEMTAEYSIYATRAEMNSETVQFEDVYSDYSEEQYYKPVKVSGKPYFSKPYIEDGITMITASYPITHNGDFKGVVLADIDIGRFSNISSSSEEFKTLNASILTDDLTIVYDSESVDKTGQNLVDYFKDPKEVKKITDGMAIGQPFTCDTVRKDGHQVSRFFYPINAQGVNWWAQT